MLGEVQNEYIHVYDQDHDSHLVWYEPLTYQAILGTIYGWIHWGTKAVRFESNLQNLHRFIINSNDLDYGLYTDGGFIAFMWRRTPPQEHFLRVCYSFGIPKPTNTHNWLKEGF